MTYLTVTMPGGRTEQISLPKALVPIATQWVQNYQRWWETIERISAINREILREKRPSRGRRPGKDQARRRPKR